VNNPKVKGDRLLGYKLHEIAAGSKFSQELTLEAIAQAVPLSEIKAALAEEAVCEQRERKLNMVMTVLVTIAMNLYARISIGAVLTNSWQARVGRRCFGVASIQSQLPLLYYTFAIM